MKIQATLPRATLAGLFLSIGFALNAFGQQAAAPPVPPKSLEADTAEQPAPGDKTPPKKVGIFGQGFKNVLNNIAGGAPNAAAQGAPVDPLEKGSSEETQKKVNELVRTAQMNMEKGRVTEAEKNVNDLITLKPYDAEYHLALGLCFRKEGKYTEALKKYQDVLDLGGPKALIALLKAEAFAAENKPEKVFEFLKEAALGGRNIINDVRTLPLLSSYQSDTEFIKLALQLEKVTISAARTHDPFTNPFPKLSEVKQGAQDLAEGPVVLTPEDQEKLLQEAKKTYERVQFYIKLEDESKAMKAYTSLREMIRKKDLLTVPRIVNDFRILVSRLEGLEIEIEGIRLKYYYNQAQIKLKQMKELFGDGEYQRVEAIHNEVVKLTQEMDQSNPRYKPVAEQILSASNRWMARAQVRQDFQARRPNIQGIVISDNAKMALLNDKLVKQGELMEDFRVVKVESNKVTFRYKGEEIPLVFRRY
jgi:tetratricopeptide (TPR) repeat protein